MSKSTPRLSPAANAWRDATPLLALLSLFALTLHGLGRVLSAPAESVAIVLPSSTGLRGLATQGLRASPAAIAQAVPPQAAAFLRRDGELGWLIHPGTLTRAELAAHLAEASGSRLRGDLLQADARLPAQPLRLPSTEAAWRWLLDARQCYTLRCAGLRCVLWLAAAVTPPTTSTPTVALPSPADPPGLFPAEPPPEPD